MKHPSTPATHGYPQMLPTNMVALFWQGDTQAAGAIAALMDAKDLD